MNRSMRGEGVKAKDAPFCRVGGDVVGGSWLARGWFNAESESWRQVNSAALEVIVERHAVDLPQSPAESSGLTHFA